MTPEQWQARRERLGLSQREVERRLGWRSGHLSIIERRPSEVQVAQLERLYEALERTRATTDR